MANSGKGEDSRTSASVGKERVGRARLSRADLEHQLEACRQELSQAHELLVEATKQQTATSEVLRIISNSPSEIQSVLDVVAANAARLCDANNARIWRLEDNVLRIVAAYGEISATSHGRAGLPLDRETVTGRAACDRRTIHVHDLAVEDSEYPVGSWHVRDEGYRTTLATPLLREGTPIGIILVRRMEVRPFHDRQIALLQTFANEAAIAIENVRLFGAEKQRTLALAHANRDLAEREAKIRRLVEANIIGIFISGLEGRILDANDAFLDVVGYDRDDLVSGRVRWTDLTPPEWHERDKRALAELSSNTIAQPYEKEFLRKDGSRVPVLIGGALFEEGGNEGVAFVLDLTERKRAEQALRRSEAYLAEAQRLSHTGSGVFTDTAILYWSEEACRIWGFDPQQGIPSREAALQRVHPEDVDRVNESLQYIVQEKKRVPIEFRIVLPDGTVKHIESTNYPVLSASGEFREIFATGVDVTERKRSEQALRKSEAKIRRLVDANIIGIFIWDFDGRILEANEAFLDIVGYDHEDLVAGRIRWTDLTPPEWHDRDTRLIQEHKVTGTLQPFEKEYFRKDGSRVPVLIGVATFEESGNQGVAFVLNLTERKRAEEALRESEYKLRQIIETMPTLVWSADPNFEPTHLNQRHLDYYGMQLEDFKRGGWKAFQHPDDLSETAKAISHAVQTGTSFQAVHRIRRADGEFRWHESRGEPLRDRQGRIIQWYGLTIDIDEAKKAEDLLRRSEAHLAEAQRLSHTGAVTYNGTAILFASEETYRIWGFDPAQGLPSRETVFQRIHPDDRDWLNAEVRRAVGEKRKYSIGYRIVLPDGTVKHLETIGQPVFSESGKLVEIFAIQTDVTERKRAEQALRESETKFRDYAETTSDWFWEIGPDYKFTLLTENAFGSDPADRIGTACWDRALDLETEPEKWRAIQATLDDRRPFRDFIYRSARGDGSPMYVKASGKPVFDGNGKFRGYRGTGTDVTAIMRAQEALRESERRSRSAIDGIAGLVSILTPNGEVETVNRQVLEYFGRSLEWIKHWGTNDAVDPADLPRIVEFYKKAMASGVPYQHELRLRRFDGEYRWFDSRGVPIRDDSGRVARWYVLLTDIEDRTRALARLEQMQSDFAHMNRVSMMGELAASLSHEITQPIASARNNARAAQNFLDKHPPDLGEVREALSCVVGDTDRAGDIVDRIRDHIKKAPPQKGHFDLNEAINEVIVLGQSAIIKNGVWVQTRLSEELLPIHGDRVQLQQVVLNLILNAVEAMGSVEAKPRDLLISSEQDHAGVLVTVRDSGPGLDPSHLERVFDAFYTTKSSGMGMGLSICRSIIDAHGGRLWAEANEPRGAVFQFTVPAVEAGGSS